MKRKLFIIILLFLFISCDLFFGADSLIVPDNAAYIYSWTGLYYLDLRNHKYVGRIDFPGTAAAFGGEFPAISEDGKKLFIAARGKSGSERFGITVIDIPAGKISEHHIFPSFYSIRDIAHIPGTTNLLTFGLQKPYEGDPAGNFIFNFVKIDYTTMSIVDELPVLHDLQPAFMPQTDLSVSPDGRWAVFTSNPTTEAIFNSILTVIDLKTFEVAAHFEVSVIPRHPVFTDNSRSLYIRSEASRDAHVYYVDLARMEIRMIYDYRPEHAETYFPYGALIAVPNSGEMLFSYHLSPRQLDLWEGISPFRVVRFNEQGEIIQSIESNVFGGLRQRVALYNDTTFCVWYHPKAITMVDESTQYIDAKILYVSVDDLRVIREEPLRIPRAAFNAGIFIIP